VACMFSECREAEEHIIQTKFFFAVVLKHDIREHHPPNRARAEPGSSTKKASPHRSGGPQRAMVANLGGVIVQPAEVRSHTTEAKGAVSLHAGEVAPLSLRSQTVARKTRELSPPRGPQDECVPQATEVRGEVDRDELKSSSVQLRPLYCRTTARNRKAKQQKREEWNSNASLRF